MHPEIDETKTDDNKMNKEMNDPPSIHVCWTSAAEKAKIVKVLYYLQAELQDKVDEHIAKCEECTTLIPFIMNAEKARKKHKDKKAHETMEKLYKMHHETDEPDTKDKTIMAEKTPTPKQIMDQLDYALDPMCCDHCSNWCAELNEEERQRKKNKEEAKNENLVKPCAEQKMEKRL